jgi:hypothetical protein
MAAGETYTAQEHREGLEPRHDDPFERNWIPPVGKCNLIPELEAWAQRIPDAHSKLLLQDAAVTIRNLRWYLDRQKEVIEQERKRVAMLMLERRIDRECIDSMRYLLEKGSGG